MSSRTSPDVKWLINEVAALAGELQRIDQAVACLAKRRDAVSKAHQACTHVLACITALPVGLALPVVQAHRDYGRRGELLKFIRALLDDAFPQKFTALEVAMRAVQQFDLKLFSTEEVSRFSVNSVGRALRKLQAAGVVERFDETRCSNSPTVFWCWNAYAPSLEDIRREAQVGAGDPQLAKGY